VIIADTVTPALRNIVDSTSGWYLSREFLLVMVTLLVVLPLSMLKSVHQLEKWSFLAVGIIFAFSIVVIGVTIHKFTHNTVGPDGDGNYHMSNVQLFRMNLQFFEALPIISLAFTCQTMIFPIWQNLEKPAPVQKMKTVVNRSLFLCGTLYTIVGVFAYFSFAATTKVSR
jgi:amino acid permease